MFKQLLMNLAGRVIARPIRRKVRAFIAATHDPKSFQDQLLRQIITKQSATAFGRDHGFSSATTFDEFRRQVPLAPYEYVAPYIERLKKGETNALLADEKVLMFALTSGSTAARKHIPITADYLADYRRGWNIWGLTAMRDHKPITMKPMMQLVGDAEEYRTQAGIPCGNLSGFTTAVQKKLVQRLYSVPAATGKIHDSPTRYYLALRFSIPRSVGMLLSANPSTLVALARAMDSRKESLIRDIRDGTLDATLALPAGLRETLAPRLKPNPEKARQLEEAIRRRDGILLPSDVWSPGKLLLGCWTGGSVGPYLRQLSHYYSDTPIRDLGLLASEGRMSIPLSDATPAGVLDITSHFFEFVPETEIDSAQPITLRAHEIEQGGSYYIVPTTKSGLYRYHISDLIRVAGFINKTPLIEFLGKGNRFANLTGEKLSEHQVTQAMEQVVKRIPMSVTAYALAPIWDERSPYYAIFLEEQDANDRPTLQRFLAEFDAELMRQNSEYEAKRQSGRLHPLRARIIATGAWLSWDRERLQKTGGSPEQYKHPCLIGNVEFATTMHHSAEVRA